MKQEILRIFDSELLNEKCDGTKPPEEALTSLLKASEICGDDPTRDQLKKAAWELVSAIERTGGCDHSGIQGTRFCCHGLNAAINQILEKLKA